MALIDSYAFLNLAETLSGLRSRCTLKRMLTHNGAEDSTGAWKLANRDPSLGGHILMLRRDGGQALRASKQRSVFLQNEVLGLFKPKKEMGLKSARYE